MVSNEHDTDFYFCLATRAPQTALLVQPGQLVHICVLAMKDALLTPVNSYDRRVLPCIIAVPDAGGTIVSGTAFASGVPIIRQRVRDWFPKDTSARRELERN